MGRGSSKIGGSKGGGAVQQNPPGTYNSQEISFAEIADKLRNPIPGKSSFTVTDTRGNDVIYTFQSHKQTDWIDTGNGHGYYDSYILDEWVKSNSNGQTLGPKYITHTDVAREVNGYLNGSRYFTGPHLWDKIRFNV